PRSAVPNALARRVLKGNSLRPGLDRPSLLRLLYVVSCFCHGLSLLAASSLLNLVGEGRFELPISCSQGTRLQPARPLPDNWWLGTELNRIHWLFRPALCRR